MAEKDPPPWKALRQQPLRAILLVLAVAVVGWFAVRFITAVTWSAVGDALRHLYWWQMVLLLGLLVVRQIFNAFSISRFIPGLRWRLAVQNDLSANLVATVAPPPADVVVRIAMFRSWRISAVDGMTGVTLNMVVFYGARFIAPVLGLMLLAIQGVQRGQILLGAVSGLLATALIVGLLLFIRSDAWAAWIGRSAARLVGRLRATVDPEVWAQAVVEYRAKVSTVLRQNLAIALVGMLTAIMVDSLILMSALRFVGVGASHLSAIDIIGGFLLVYPITILPLFGLGVMDAILVSNWTDIAGDPLGTTIVAGVVVWRTVTIGGTLLLGVLSTWWWRRQTAGSPDAQPSADDPAGLESADSEAPRE